MTQVVLLRHGQSRWNLENRFTGWVDVELTPEGVAQARRAGELIKAEGVRFDHAFTSVLRRAIETCRIALQTAGQPGVPEEQDWRLNERHYGALTGLDKAETAARHGDEQVKVWRRSYDIPPPPMDSGGEHDFSQDPRYNGKDIPNTESLKTTLERVLPYWEAQIAPRLRAGRPVLVAAHGNSLRAIVKHLFGLSEDEIVGVEIPTGNPLLIELNDALRPVSARYLDRDRAQPLPAIA
jgi:2,3-bisphosphoglycerate-dependent phosphoglycerate mutase